MPKHWFALKKIPYTAFFEGAETNIYVSKTKYLFHMKHNLNIKQKYLACSVAYTFHYHLLIDRQPGESLKQTKTKY